MVSSEKAQEYLGYLLINNLLTRLKSKESELIKKYQKNAAKELAEKLLLAPNFIYAAAMMKQNGIFFGKGDFQNIIDVLKSKQSAKYKDMGNKLCLIKTGAIFKKGV